MTCLCSAKVVEMRFIYHQSSNKLIKYRTMKQIKRQTPRVPPPGKMPLAVGPFHTLCAVLTPSQFHTATWQWIAGTGSTQCAVHQQSLVSL
jgi:hypothetical protein